MHLSGSASFYGCSITWIYIPVGAREGLWVGDAVLVAFGAVGAGEEEAEGLPVDDVTGALVFVDATGAPVAFEVVGAGEGLFVDDVTGAPVAFEVVGAGEGPVVEEVTGALVGALVAVEAVGAREGAGDGFVVGERGEGAGVGVSVSS